MTKRNWIWGTVLGVTFGLGLALGVAQTAEARSPSSGGPCSEAAEAACMNAVLRENDCVPGQRSDRCALILIQAVFPRCNAERAAHGCPPLP